MIRAEREVVIVTGASSGIGEALVREYASSGARVVLAARNVERMGSITASIIESGGAAAFVECDVTNLSNCQHVVDFAIQRYGVINTLICSAGISMRAPFEDVDIEVLKRVMDVNFCGSVNIIKCALPHLITSRGFIVGLSSLAGMHGLPHRSGYSASKYALEGFLSALRIELLGKGVGVMIAYPGYTASNIRYSALLSDGSIQGSTPRDESKMMTPQRVATLIRRDASSRRRVSLMDYQGRAVALLRRLYPPLLDRIFANAVAKEHNFN